MQKNPTPRRKVETEILETRSKLESLNSVQAEFYGYWVPARPLDGDWTMKWPRRIRGAWNVLMGRAQWIRWF